VLLARTGRLLRRHGGFTYPTPLNLNDAVVGAHAGDTLQNYWNMWWVRHAPLNLGQHPYQASYLHYPICT
jgi:hypothetical protein